MELDIVIGVLMGSEGNKRTDQLRTQWEGWDCMGAATRVEGIKSEKIEGEGGSLLFSYMGISKCVWYVIIVVRRRRR